MTGFRTCNITLSRQVARKNCSRNGEDAAPIGDQPTDYTTRRDLQDSMTLTRFHSTSGDLERPSGEIEGVDP